jgi:5-methylcytosine-specific restriction endonuclease McrA
MKTCRACGQALPLERFQKDRTYSSGHKARCKSCVAAVPRKRTAARLEYERQWRETHRETLRRQARARYERNREAENARSAAWRRANPEKWSIANRTAARRSFERRRNTPGFATAEQVRQRIAYYGWRCWLCGEPWAEVDHVIPVKHGGTNWPSNLRPACWTCNRSKGSKVVHKDAAGLITRVRYRVGQPNRGLVM